MKISVITVVRNNVDTIGNALSSVRDQSYHDIEHIVIDGRSTDGTIQVIERNRQRVSKFISEHDQGIYDAMNKGLRLATGDAIGFLNADDVFSSPAIVSRIAEVLVSADVDACYANLVYVAKNNPARTVRYWRSQPYRPGLFERGWMPAHPTFYVKRWVYEKYGGFDLSFRLQADFDLAMRLIALHGIRTAFVPEDWVRMRWVGVSNKGLWNVFKGNLEAYRICQKNGISVPPWFPVRKILGRIPQFFYRK